MVQGSLKQAAESARSKTSEAMNAAKADTAAMTGFLHNPIVRTALPFVNGGISGMVSTNFIMFSNSVMSRVDPDFHLR